VSAEIQERVRESAAAQTRLRIVGGSRWLGAGRPVAASDTISLATCAGVVDYVPGDLTITVRAGTTLADLARITGEHNQWFPANPFGGDDGTIGATVATGSSGPLAQGFGGIRDLVLGAEIVTGEGKVIRGGGRVVKNVAGFDLVRLMTGSWGTLGVITEVTLRLYATPSHRVTLAMDAPTDVRKLAEWTKTLLDAAIIPFSLELVSDKLASRIGLAPRQTILVEFGGNSAAVSSQRYELRRLGAVITEAPDGIWEELRTMDADAHTVFRMSGLPEGLASRWERARYMTGTAAVMHASLGRGTVRCILRGEAPDELIEQLAAPDSHDTVILETASPQAWSRVSPSAIGDRVSQRIRRAFDPAGILNPGILGPLQ
jgi:glycolate oxidase FAD binding subunit